MTTYLCNLIVPGAAKSGTSALHEALDQHQQICMSSKKEPHYFAKSENYIKGPNYHNSLFSSEVASAYYGESSTGYMISPIAIERIYKSIHNPKIIILLRDPVERTISHWRWRVKLGLEKRPLRQAVEVDGFGFEPEKPDRYGYTAYLQFSAYKTYCPMWIETFGKENCLILDSQDLSKNFSSTMEGCFSFLELQDLGLKEKVISNITDATITRPSPLMTRIMSVVPSGFKKSTRYKNFRRGILASFARNANVEITPADREFLADALKEDMIYFRSVVS